MTIAGTNIEVYTTTGSDTGVHAVTIRATETNSGLTDDQSFTLTVKCVQSLAPQPIANVVYYLSETAITKTATYSLTPSDCVNELTYKVVIKADTCAV